MRPDLIYKICIFICCIYRSKSWEVLGGISLVSGEKRPISMAVMWQVNNAGQNVTVPTSIIDSIDGVVRHILEPPAPPPGLQESIGRIMDYITIKTPNPKRRLYWSLIEFIDWRYSQSCWYFRPALWTIASLTFSLVSSPPPFHVWISVLYTRIQCLRGGGGMWS